MTRFACRLSQQQEQRCQQQEQTAGLQTADQKYPCRFFCGKDPLNGLLNHSFHETTPRDQDIPGCCFFQGTNSAKEL
jgi:hypothetical protein